MKAFVFDLDETLGHFVEIGQMHNIISRHMYISQDLFNQWLQIYPFLLRPDILIVLLYLCAYKKQNMCRIIVYTNNTGSSEWVNKIIQYIEYRVGEKVFDYVITGFRPNASMRSSHDKTYSDLCRCAYLEPYDEICFIDDQDHPFMKVPQVNYIRIPPYRYHPTDMVELLVRSPIGKHLCTHYSMVILLKQSLMIPYIPPSTEYFPLLIYIKKFIHS